MSQITILAYFVSLFVVFLGSAFGAFGASPGTPHLQVYAHRGVRSFAPENTMPGFRAALAIGTDFVDMDVVLTKEGEVLISHDPLLKPELVRKADGQFIEKNKYAVKNLTLKELQQFDVGRLNPESAYAKFFPDQLPVDGTRMPTLREVVRFVERETHGSVGFQIEMKTDPTHPESSADPVVFASAVYRVLKEEKIIGRTEVQAFDFRCLTALQKLDSHLKTAYLTSRDNEKGGGDDFYSQDPALATLWTGGALLAQSGGSIPQMVKVMGGFAWEPEDAELTLGSLKEAHSLGLKVVVWSWPEKLGTAFDAKMTAKMIDWGVDGIITDDPGRLISMLAARGASVPARWSLKGR